MDQEFDWRWTLQLGFVVTKILVAKRRSTDSTPSPDERTEHKPDNVLPHIPQDYATCPRFSRCFAKSNAVTCDWYEYVLD